MATHLIPKSERVGVWSMSVTKLFLGLAFFEISVCRNICPANRIECIFCYVTEVLTVSSTLFKKLLSLTMCYSTALRKKREEIEAKVFAQMTIPMEYEPYFHLNGFTFENLQIIKMDEPDLIYPASWGFVADWGIDNISAFRKKYNTLNAKSETLLTSGMYKDSARDKRCLIIADGFFEPTHIGGVAVPHFCYQPTNEYEDGSDIFVFAGIYNEIQEDAYTASIITTEANEFFAKVHNKRKRMPLVLDETFVDEWLSDGLNDSQLNELLAVGFTRDEFKAHPVSRDLYKKGINTNKPYIVESVDSETLF